MPRPAGTQEGDSGEKEEVKEDWRKRVDLSHLKDASLRKRVKALLESYSTVFEGKLGQINATEHHINLKPGTPPILQQPYRAGPEKREHIREQIEYQLAAGVIEPAQS